MLSWIGLAIDSVITLMVSLRSVVAEVLEFVVMWCCYVITCNAAFSRASAPSSFCVYSGCFSLKTKINRLMSYDSACFPFSSFFPRLLYLDLPSPASTSTSSTASHHSSSLACCFTAICGPPPASNPHEFVTRLQVLWHSLVHVPVRTQHPIPLKRIPSPISFPLVFFPDPVPAATRITP